MLHLAEAHPYGWQGAFKFPAEPRYRLLAYYFRAEGRGAILSCETYYSPTSNTPTEQLQPNTLTTYFLSREFLSHSACVRSGLIVVR
jgi:hypothetical protein